VPQLALANISRILIIRPSALGDVCRSLPLAAECKRLMPHAAVHWLVQDSFADAVSAHPCIDEVVLFARNRLKDGLGAKRTVLTDLARTLRRNQYDLVIDAQGLLRSGLMAWATRAPMRIGHAEAREGAWLAYTHRVRASHEHTVDRMLTLLDPLRALARERPYAPSPETALPPSWQLVPPQADSDWANSSAWSGRSSGQGLLIAIAPTSRWPAKQWPIERFTELAVALLSAHEHARIIVLGGPGEQAACAPLLALAARDARITSLIGATSVGQLIAAIGQAHVLIACDSAALHMAAAQGRPLVALYGPTDVRKVGPYRRSASVISHLRRGDVLQHKNPAAVALMQRITTQEVARATLEILAASGR